MTMFVISQIYLVNSVYYMSFLGYTDFGSIHVFVCALHRLYTIHTCISYM